MGLAPGTRLGAYEVAAAIGAGGMGEVYRARDLKLDRDVALKILPEAFAPTSSVSHDSSARPRRWRRSIIPTSRRSGIRFGNPEFLPARVTASRTSGATRAFDVLPDGQFVGPISSSEEAALASAASNVEIRVVLGWFDELRARVPAGR